MLHDRNLLIAEIPHLRRYACALLRDSDAADDLVQSCLERAMNKLHLWQSERKLRPWLFTILHNLYIDLIRHRVVGGTSVPLDLIEELSQPGRQEEIIFAKSVLAAIDLLPPDQRDVLILIGVNELSYEEAAQVLSVPIGTLLSRLSRAREKLRQSLGMERPRVSIRQVK